ncbi:MAG: hypothetical protein B6I18_04675 [Bacteroidetes bacterium 4572_112]|nr:MAG: hypothetical protein B6I18_04675 [Bacteroidetes bacterium 4572_112]
MEKHILSKTTYIKGEQCLMQLFLTKKFPKLRDRIPAERLAIFSRGTKVGIYAQELFLGGIDAGPKHYSQYHKAITLTQELMQKGQDVIYEAAFQANKTLILLDILVRNGDKWDAYEVKSSIKLSDTYYKDAALQYNVLINSGVEINSFSLIHINKEYTRNGEIDKKELFIITDVTENVKSEFENVNSKIEEKLDSLNSDAAPKVTLGPQCFSPYDCDFIGHCWKNIKRPSVFDIPSLELEQQFYLHKKYGSLSSILENDDSIDEYQSTEIRCQIDKQDHLELSDDTMEGFEELYNAEEEKYALKILYFIPALPLYNNTKPYQKIAFAYAIMPLDGSSNAKIFISNGQNNPEIEIIEKLSIEAEDKVFINLNGGHDDIESFDLQQIIDNGEYYSPKMQKDYNNKSLSAALGNRPQWMAIESDIVAAQYYDEILRGHSKSVEKLNLIKDYLINEVNLVKQFFDFVSQ